jgi:hypothetical protein
VDYKLVQCRSARRRITHGQRVRRLHFAKSLVNVWTPNWRVPPCANRVAVCAGASPACEIIESRSGFYVRNCPVVNVGVALHIHVRVRARVGANHSSSRAALFFSRAEGGEEERAGSLSSTSGAHSECEGACMGEPHHRLSAGLNVATHLTAEHRAAQPTHLTQRGRCAVCRATLSAVNRSASPSSAHEAAFW